MSVKNELFAVGFDKNGQFDFGVSCQVQGLTYDKMNELRAMLVAGIGTMEDMFRRSREKEFDASSSSSTSTASSPKVDARSQPVE